MEQNIKLREDYKKLLLHQYVDMMELMDSVDVEKRMSDEDTRKIVIDITDRMNNMLKIVNKLESKMPFITF